MATKAASSNWKTLKKALHSNNQNKHGDLNDSVSAGKKRKRDESQEQGQGKRNGNGNKAAVNGVEKLPSSSFATVASSIQIAKAPSKTAPAKLDGKKERSVRQEVKINGSAIKHGSKEETEIGIKGKDGTKRKGKSKEGSHEDRNNAGITRVIGTKELEKDEGQEDGDWDNDLELGSNSDIDIGDGESDGSGNRGDGEEEGTEGQGLDPAELREDPGKNGIKNQEVEKRKKDEDITSKHEASISSFGPIPAAPKSQSKSHFVSAATTWRPFTPSLLLSFLSPNASTISPTNAHPLSLAPVTVHNPGKYISMDCEMVGVGPQGEESALARVAICDWEGGVVYDSFVKSKERVTDYRTWVSGVRPGDLKNAPSFEKVQADVSKLLTEKFPGSQSGGRVLVGHAVYNDLKALLLSHGHQVTRDTARYPPLRQLAGTKRPALRVLVEKCLGLTGFQKKATPGSNSPAEQGHSPVDDCRAAMAIYRKYHKQWEASLRQPQHSLAGKKRKRNDARESDEESNDSLPNGGGRSQRGLGMASMARYLNLVNDDDGEKKDTEALVKTSKESSKKGGETIMLNFATTGGKPNTGSIPRSRSDHERKRVTKTSKTPSSTGGKMSASKPPPSKTNGVAGKAPRRKSRTTDGDTNWWEEV